MISAGEACALLAERLDYDAKRFYFAARDLPVGVGEIFSGLRFPLYEDTESVFYTVEGTVYILTHECDIANERPFSSYALICPVIELGNWVEEYQQHHSEDELRSLLAHIAQRNVFRVMYLPPLNPDLPFGGLMYFNQITHTHINGFRAPAAALLGSVTNYGLVKVDHMIENHLLRPKAVLLAG